MLIGKIFSYDERRDLFVGETKEATLTFFVEKWVELIEKTLKEKGSFFVALSGGSTPQLAFQKLCSSPYREKIDWQKVFLFWSDERNVPLDSEKSNFYQAMSSGFNNVPIPKEQIFPMSRGKDPKEEAKAYEKLLHTHLGNSGFDLVLLGMGEDGHIASLFPNTKALQEKKRWVVANFIPQKSSWRLTLTFPCLYQGSNIWLLVTGSGKREVVKKVLSLPSPSPLLPACQVGSVQKKALWFLDKDSFNSSSLNLLDRKSRIYLE